MDNAVAIVQAYLNLNGYFTVTEYPVVEAMQRGGYQAATDLDVLAFRFPRAGRLVPSRDRAGSGDLQIGETDPALGDSGETGDMIIGEVKEGRAELNRGARNPAVLRAALTRFGCCTPESAPEIVESLLREGTAVTGERHQVRLVAFGSLLGSPRQRYHAISLGHVVRFLQEYLRRHWDVLHHAQFKHPGFSFLVTLEKARQGDPPR